MLREKTSTRKSWEEPPSYPLQVQYMPCTIQYMPCTIQYTPCTVHRTHHAPYTVHHAPYTPFTIQYTPYTHHTLGAAIASAAGSVDAVVDSEAEAFESARRFLSYLPSSAWELSPHVPPGSVQWSTADDVMRVEEELLRIVPRNRKRLFDMRRVCWYMCHPSSSTPCVFTPLVAVYSAACHS
jgi:hypothetical protein